MFKLINNDNVLNYLNISSKILPIIILIFLLTVISTYYFNKKKCNPIKVKVENNLKYIEKNIGSIKEIKLTKSAPGWKVNLINHDTVITDAYTISIIRSMLINRKMQDWHHPIRDWEVLLVLKLSNNEQIEINVSKLKNSEINGMTHLYFLFGDCSDDMPSYSLEMGNYLEKLTNYNGTKYK